MDVVIAVIGVLLMYYWFPIKQNSEKQNTK